MGNNIGICEPIKRHWVQFNASGIHKSIFFSIDIGLISTYKGYQPIKDTLKRYSAIYRNGSR